MRIRTYAVRLSAVIALAFGATALAAALVEARTPRTGAAAALDVQPFPGTPDAPPSTDVGFPALAPRQIKSLRVIGSRSGLHAGRIVKLPGGGGAAFIPDRPFAAGERVAVRAILGSPAAGTASGLPGARHLSFSFAVAITVPRGQARPAGTADLLARRASIAAAPQTRSFYSEPWLHPPVATISGRDPDPSQGDIFTSVENSIQVGPLILDPHGRLVYFRPVTRSVTFDADVQTYQGQSVLTYWQGPAIDFGHGVILNHAYQQVGTVYAGHGDSADAHEFQITPQGNALISVYAPVKANLSSIGGPRHGTLIDSIIQEVNIATGQVIWEWHASGHVALNSTHARKPGSLPYDFFHLNSIQQLPGDKLLISGRNTWALYEIDMRSGRVVLVIGGRHSDFRMGHGTNFEWQHDARMQPDGTITVFDNATIGHAASEPESRALRIRLNFKRRRATLVQAFTNHPPVLASSQGSVQPLSDGNTFVGWGAAPYLGEFGSGGAELFSVRFPSPFRSYRGYRYAWWGQPLTPPSVAASAGAQGTHVYASWNGATTVAAWRVLTGPSPKALTAAGQFAKANFETAMWVYNTQPYLAAQALDANGNVLGTSAVVHR